MKPPRPIRSLPSPRSILALPGQILGALAPGLGNRASPASAPDITFSREYAHALTEQARIAATPQAVMDAVTDLARFSERFTLHASWRTPPPTSLTTGTVLAQTLRVLGTPIRMDWHITSINPRTLVLEGSGPLGTQAGIGVSVTGAPSDTATLTITSGFHSDSLKGPMGSLVARALNNATKDSLARFQAMLTHGGDAPALAERPAPAIPAERPGPIRHDASGTLLDPWTPIIIGIGEITHRPDESGPRSPLELATAAAREALADAGLDDLPDTPRTRISAVPSTSWAYGPHHASLIATALGAPGADLAQSAPLGGDGPLRLTNAAATAIARGELDPALTIGAEAFATLAEHGPQDWDADHQSPFAPLLLGSDKEGNNAAEEAVGLLAPAPMYALMDSALRASLQLDPLEHTTREARLWSRFSDIAATNPAAWLPEPHTAEQISTPTARNRPVATPYTKLMTANPAVDQGGAILLCSAHAAEQAGIPQDRWVFPHAGAHATEEWFVSARDDLATIPAIKRIGDALRDHIGIEPAKADHIDLYSCFPYAVIAAARELDLDPADPARPLTCTGGLTFAGGPLNNYATHGLAGVVRAARREPGSIGLSTALGWYATKHAATVVSTTPPATPFADIDAAARWSRPPARPATAEQDGTSIIEAWTVTHGSDGTPDAVILSSLDSNGTRILTRSADPAVIGRALAEDLIGMDLIRDGEQATISTENGAGFARVAEHARGTRVTPALLREWNGPVCTLTLNRPRTRNAIDLALALALEQALDDAEADPQTQVVILTGSAGDFSTGMDLRAAARGEFPVAPRRGLLGIAALPPALPTIAAVEGNALAGGFEVALACDMIVAARDARFGLPEPSRGLVAAAGGVLRLAQRMPRASALEFTLTGGEIPADRLHQLGIVNRLTKPGQALREARELAGQIAANAPLSLALTRRIVDESAGWPADEAFERQSDIASEATFSDDAQEGMAAFDERREPRWTGR
ncbi:crotonase/enoyl-CoA hydratase family protein [Hoyosella sp. G463]|uniref:Crotonase/enoyl-CoA hydratase family protein n=1 Tax=Lolliginicoccus lacisalsi TaxID=2742202 RepID=A0A927JEG8_9ACTN|nr:crotonase/enoyl-CoA hydratase family protein [Lolliginicoccus lacisalsi]MBD8507791.1 crotonase/enoyl-CoA hydratase family protein [Lolliginicoccus lacisalsi]